jgi:hypothetical protein
MLLAESKIREVKSLNNAVKKFGRNSQAITYIGRMLAVGTTVSLDNEFYRVLNTTIGENTVRVYFPWQMRNEPHHNVRVESNAPQEELKDYLRMFTDHYKKYDPNVIYTKRR